MPERLRSGRAFLLACGGDLLFLLRRQSMGHLRFQKSRRNRVHGDSPVSEFAGQASRESVESGLGKGINGQSAKPALSNDGANRNNAPQRLISISRTQDLVSAMVPFRLRSTI